jgi:uncharacterized SAM-binding protein YcdF (DUF218 family)
MTVVGSNTGNAAPDVARARQLPRTADRLLRGMVRATIAICVAAPLALAVGFLWFILRLPSEEVSLTRNADGIVVLTGGASRISDGIELLAGRRGQRLLISGANRSTTTAEISRRNPEFERWVHCCVDFDRALNTLGNAIEIKRWTERRGFHSLIVVTSNYHMPRAMAEIAHQLPSTTLIAFPVISERQRAEPWWGSVATTKLLLSEYLKYILVKVRIRLNPAYGTGEPAERQ